MYPLDREKRMRRPGEDVQGSSQRNGLAKKMWDSQGGEERREVRHTAKRGSKDKGKGYIELYVRSDTKERRGIASVGREIKPLIKPQKDP